MYSLQSFCMHKHCMYSRALALMNSSVTGQTKMLQTDKSITFCNKNCNPKDVTCANSVKILTNQTH